MGSGKTVGNLRDFRIDSQGQELRSEGPELRSQHQEQHQVPTARPAQKVATPRKSSVQEWDRHEPGFAPPDLWKVWEDDVDLQPLPHKAPSPARSERLPQQSVKPRAQPVVPPPKVNKAPRPAMPQVAFEEPVEALSAAAAEEAVPVAHDRTPWSAELALTERRMERTGMVDFSNAFKKQDLLKTQTREFMSRLREGFRRNIEIFNEARQSGAHAIHLYRVSNTEEDFMLFRNSVKLVVTGQRAGRVILAFNQYLGQIFAPSQNPTFELEAAWGAFDQLFWSYKAERIVVDDVVRFFISEFARQSYK